MQPAQNQEVAAVVVELMEVLQGTDTQIALTALAYISGHVLEVAHDDLQDAEDAAGQMNQTVIEVLHFARKGETSWARGKDG